MASFGALSSQNSLRDTHRRRPAEASLEEDSSEEASQQARTSGATELAAVEPAAPPPAPRPRLPPRIVCWHPDGSFCLGVDPLRLHELLDGAYGEGIEESDGGVEVQRGALPSSLEEDPTFDVSGWRRAYRRHRATFIVLVLLDIAYLCVLLGFRLAWGTEHSGPESGAVQFVLAHPSDLQVAFLGVCAGTDAVAGLGAARDYSPILSIFVLWSVVLTAFAVMTMPLLFLFLRVALVVTAFQLRFSLARVRNVLPPTTAVEWLTSAGQGVVAGVRGVGQVAAAPFLWAARHGRRRRRAGDVEQGAAQATVDGQQQRGERRSGRLARASRGGPEGSPRLPRGSGSRPSSSGEVHVGGTAGTAALSSARSSRSGSAGPGRASTRGASLDIELGPAGLSRSSASSGQAGSSRRARSVAGAPSRSTTPAGLGVGERSAGTASTGLLYVQLMADLEAVQLTGPGSTVVAGPLAMAAVRRTTSSRGEGAPGGAGAGTRARSRSSSGVPHQGGEAAADAVDPFILFFRQQLQQQQRHQRRRRRSVPLVTVEQPPDL